MWEGCVKGREEGKSRKGRAGGEEGMWEKREGRRVKEGKEEQKVREGSVKRGRERKAGKVGHGVRVACAVKKAQEVRDGM